MEESKGSVGAIYEVLDQQKKLEEIQALLVNVIDKVNHAVKALTVENLQLTRSELDEEIQKQEPQEVPVIQSEEIAPLSIADTNAINSQYLEMLEAKPCYNEEEVDSEDELPL